MPPERIDFLGLPLDVNADINAVCDLISGTGPRMVTFINPQAWAIARANADYLNALNQMTLVLPDGEGVARVCRSVTEKPCLRISFDMTSLADPFFKRMVTEEKTLMLIGGSPGVDEGMHLKLAGVYKGIRIMGSSHGYDDFDPKIRLIRNREPDVVLVGMGSPRQEAFLMELRSEGYRGLSITCGGFFDQYLQGGELYYPPWVDQFDLRFAYRLYKEPQRLWRRYFIDYQRFILAAVPALFKKHVPHPIQRFIENERKK